ncbi:uncharacterized protein Z518_01732 [Rhinocladiella mackenziei CBS 650.93]|uniref:CFEM domain-containing protein n=1 Tax=Rhinocladiella mackenziei CBS 650.93 TaxID=1442369 RepID=A0A0D2HJ05_9EURO|nr:uncharacterized protein Z518_01732 [Rhinocladiella mackenziei CBS 650.93]KIX10648.1 hypothetical protein Z518_01732 [Rhinocladiella mackenziei CBS 650.93]
MSARFQQPLLAFLAIIHVATAATVTLTESPAYASQRSCAIYCWYAGFSVDGGPDQLASELDCPVDPIENDCFCRPDLQASADSYLKSCVSGVCDGNTVDVNSAVSIYDSYCTSAGYLRAEETAPAQTSSGTQQPPATVTVTALRTVTVSSGQQSLRSPTSLTTGTPTSPTSDDTLSSSSNSADSQNDSGLETGELVGIIVGILGFIATSIGVWFSYRMLKNKRAGQGNGAFMVPPHPHPIQPVTHTAKYPVMAQDNYFGYR